MKSPAGWGVVAALGAEPERCRAQKAERGGAGAPGAWRGGRRSGRQRSGPAPPRASRASGAPSQWPPAPPLAARGFH